MFSLEQVYKFEGLLEFNIYDDFGIMLISQVKTSNIDDQIYLSLFKYGVFMKKCLIAAALFASSTLALATTKHVHNWVAGVNQYWHTGIVVTNVCHQDSVNVVIKFWDSTGAVLRNRTLSTGQATNSEGEISMALGPHQTSGVQISGANFPVFTSGSASVSSYYEQSGVECLTGAYHSYYTPPHSGHSRSFLLNSGNPF